MSGEVAEIEAILSPHQLAVEIAEIHMGFETNRTHKITEWKELRNYIFAIDTTKTTNAQLPWKNKTTVPKLCSLRDNLHANW